MSEFQRQDRLEPDLPAHDQSPQEIERQIERTRERMSSNIDALGNKLSRDNLKQQAKDAIAGKAHDLAANVGDQARQTGSRAVGFITGNPLAVAAASLGAIWLFTKRKGEHELQERADELRTSARKRARGARGGFDRMWQEHPLPLLAGGAVIGLALGMLPKRRTTGSTRHQLAGRVSNVAGRVKDAAVEAGSEVEHQIKKSAGRVAKAAKRRFASR